VKFDWTYNLPQIQRRPPLRHRNAKKEGELIRRFHISKLNLHFSRNESGARFRARAVDRNLRPTSKANKPLFNINAGSLVAHSPPGHTWHKEMPINANHSAIQPASLASWFCGTSGVKNDCLSGLFTAISRSFQSLSCLHIRQLCASICQYMATMVKLKKKLLTSFSQRRT